MIPPDPERPVPWWRRDRIANGLLLAVLTQLVGLPLVVGVALAVESGVGGASGDLEGLWALVLGLSVGWTQILYAPVPLVVLIVKRRRATLKGFLIVTGLLFLLTSGCWGLMSLSNG